MSLVSRAPPQELVHALLDNVLLELALAPARLALALQVSHMQWDNQVSYPLKISFSKEKTNKQEISSKKNGVQSLAKIMESKLPVCRTKMDVYLVLHDSRQSSNRKVVAPQTCRQYTSM